MRMFGLHFGEIHDDDLDRLRASAPTYDHMGSTLDPHCDSRGNRYERQVTVGHGRPAFAAARTALRDWRPQRSLGASIIPEHVVPDHGETVIVRLGALRLCVPNRIVAVVDEPNRYGYAYGTLPGHPERGEELFLLELDDAGAVLLTIRVDAQPADQLRRLGPLIRPIQRAALRRYQAAVRDAIGPTEPPS